MKNILFICRYNRFRSKFAEAFFNTMNTNPDIQAKSAGLFKGNPISQSILQQAESHGIVLTKTPQAISEDLLDWQDIIIVVADNVPIQIFDDHRIVSEKIEVWDTREKETQYVIEGIRDRVKKLLKY